jgi:hypothetical protein
MGLRPSGRAPLPPRRERQRSGISRGPQRQWPRHRAFLRRHRCVVPGCLAEPIEVSHLRTATNAGTGLKPHDAFAVSMCGIHHREYHNSGHASFERRYRLNLGLLAAAFVRESPDWEMRASLSLVSAEQIDRQGPAGHV